MKEKYFKILKKITISLFVLLILVIVLIIVGQNERQEPKTIAKTEIEDNTSKSQQVEIGEVLKTKYFDVTINSAQLCESVETNNMLINLPPERGHRYIILNTTFKNTDNESRAIFDGKIIIDYNGKRYNFDHSETILAEGWGLFFDQINPLTSKTTNLVYKIPSEIEGNTWYQPGRSNKNDIIFVGSISR